MGQNWSIRAYREADEEAILELWKAVYPEREYNDKQWMRWWRWMYKENPSGAPVIWFAEANGKLVGQYAIIRVKMKIGNKVIIGAQSLDTVTHPEYRHKGVFQTLAKKTYEQAANEGVHIVYGFPNQYSYPGFIRRLDWFDIATTQTLLKVLYWGNITKKRVRNRFLSSILAPAINLVSNEILFRTQKTSFVQGLEIAQISSFDERVNEFWAEISGQYQIMVVRNKDYLNWRYVNIPDANYLIYVAEIAGKIYGYLVFQCTQTEQTKVGNIFDILAQSEKIAQHLISKAIEHCKQERVDTIYCSMIANNLYLKAFRKNGFVSLPFVKGSKFCAYSSSPNIPKEFLKDPKNWVVQIGDSDRR